METSDADKLALYSMAYSFAALCLPSRLSFFRLLLSAYLQGLPAGEIQKELNIAGATLSHHLDKLRQVGIVTSEKDRQWIWYSVEEKSLARLLDFLFEECCTRNRVVDIEHIGKTIAHQASSLDCCE